jgi:hypothetical protein
MLGICRLDATSSHLVTTGKGSSRSRAPIFGATPRLNCNQQRKEGSGQANFAFSTPIYQWRYSSHGQQTQNKQSRCISIPEPDPLDKDRDRDRAWSFSKRSKSSLEARSRSLTEAPSSISISIFVQRIGLSKCDFVKMSTTRFDTTIALKSYFVILAMIYIIDNCT